MLDKKYGYWFPEYCLIRTENGWLFPTEINLNKNLLYYDNGLIKSKKPVIKDKIYFKGYLLGSNKTLFKKSDSVINENDEFFNIQEFDKLIYKEISKVFYEGYLYRYDFNPILSYEYKISSYNNINLINLEYKL